jgi:molybdopterin synthase catalytic subunit
MIEVSAVPIDTALLQRSLENPAAGGYCAFEGWVRNENEGHVVERLEYEAYEPLVIEEGAKVLAEARALFPYLEARCVHRVGLLEIGECAVWIGVAAKHRDEAFRACRYIIDEIKIRLPIWKKEHYADGEALWVNCRRCSGAARGHEPHRFAT